MVIKTHYLKQAAIAAGYSLTATASICLAVPDAAIAQQIPPQQLAPNPNPAGETIFIDNYNFDDDTEGSVTNLENYINNGRISIRDGLSTNEATFNNFGEIELNSADAQNNGVFNNFEAGNFSITDGFFENNGIINNFGYFDSREAQTRDTDGIVNSGTINNQGSLLLYLPSSLDNTGTVSNTGTITLEFSPIKNSGFFQNDGLIEEDFEVAYILNSGDFINDGTLDDVSLDENTGLFVNTGFHSTTGVDADHYVNKATGTVLNNGETIVSTENNFSLKGFENLGLLKGSGSYTTENREGSDNFPFVFAQGTIAPGGTLDNGEIIDTAGTLTFTGDTIFESGLLDFSIGGFEPGTHDILEIVDSTVDLLGGKISFSPLGDFDILEALAPGESKTLSFLKADGGILNVLSALDFSQLEKTGLILDVAQQDNELILTASRSPATDPSPTDPSPTDPSPTDPSPTTPSPTDPSPTDPSIGGPTTTEIPEPSLIGGLALLGLLGLRRKRAISR